MRMPFPKPLTAVVTVLYAISLAPILVVVLASFSDTNYTVFPPQGLTLRWYSAVLSRPEFIDSFFLSLWLAALVAIVSTVLSTLIAFAVVRYRFPGRSAVTALFLAPIMLPGIVLAIGLLQFYSMTGLAQSAFGLIAGHIVVVTPFAARLIIASLTRFDQKLELAARSLGSSPLRAFRTVTLPIVRSGMMGAAVFAFIMSFDNVTISVFLVGPGLSTLPVRIFHYLEYQNDPLIAAASTLQIVVALVLVLILDRLVGIKGVFMERGR